MVDSSTYKQWLASGETQTQIIETIQVNHPSWSVVRLVNFDRDVRVKIENGNFRTFTASRFYMEPAEITDTTSQSTILSVSALGGILYDRIKAMTFEDRQSRITINYRLYLSNNLSNILVSPAPTWTVHAIEATHEVVRAELRAETLRSQKIGLYYTQNEFPALVYL